MYVETECIVIWVDFDLVGLLDDAMLCYSMR